MEHFSTCKSLVADSHYFKVNRYRIKRWLTFSQKLVFYLYIRVTCGPLSRTRGPFPNQGFVLSVKSYNQNVRLFAVVLANTTDVYLDS